jgi:parallel beta-helix repeat protein
MHVFYMSNNSTRNIITNNTIIRAMGDPVRIRDSSSYNLITGNTFSQAGAESMFEEVT